MNSQDWLKVKEAEKRGREKYDNILPEESSETVEETEVIDDSV